MLVSDIISNGRLIADIPNTSFYTDAEALYAVQLSWKQIYAFLCNNNDDYNLTKEYLTLSADFTADPVRSFTWIYELPEDFFRLRLLQYQGQNGSISFWPVHKMTLENFGNTQDLPGYRLVGVNLELYDPVEHQGYCLWYYPTPATLAIDTDLAYPNNMIPEAMAYQLAAEIRRKQKLEVDLWQSKVKEIMDTMRFQQSRDEAGAMSPKNIFNEGYTPWV